MTTIPSCPKGCAGWPADAAFASVASTVARSVNWPLAAPAVYLRKAQSGSASTPAATRSTPGPSWKNWTQECSATPVGALPAPRSFALLVLTRLAACGPETRRLLEAVAVLGQRTPLRLAGDVADVEDTAAALGEAVDMRLLAVPAPSVVPGVGFPHPLVRAAIYRDVSPARRTALHARAATLLDGPASLEHRIAAALVEDPSLAADVEIQARFEAAAGAHAQAAAHFSAAAHLHPGRSTRERLLLDAVEVLLGAGSVTEAATAAAQTAGFLDSARRNYLLGRIAFLRGHHAEAEELFLDAWERAGTATGPDLGVGGSVAAHLAWAHSLHMRLDLVVEWAKRAITGNAVHLNVPVHSLVMTSLGLAGRADEAPGLRRFAVQATASAHPRRRRAPPRTRCGADVDR